MDGSQVSSFISEVGLPISMCLALGGSVWWLIKFVLSSIVEKITEAQAETDRDINELKTILIQLIDKNQLLANDLIRLDLLIRIKWNIAPEEKRIGRNPDGKSK